MPKMGKEADINCRDAALAWSRGSERDVAESRINVYTHDAREMCET
jgi:hypothetical protein